MTSSGPHQVFKLGKYNLRWTTHDILHQSSVWKTKFSLAAYLFILLLCPPFVYFCQLPTPEEIVSDQLRNGGSNSICVLMYVTFSCHFTVLHISRWNIAGLSLFVSIMNDHLLCVVVLSWQFQFSRLWTFVSCSKLFYRKEIYCFLALLPRLSSQSSTAHLKQACSSLAWKNKKKLMPRS